MVVVTMDVRIAAIALLLTSLLLVPSVNADGPAPDVPQNLNASPASDRIVLTWTPPQGTTPVTSYVIYRGENPGSKSIISETTDTSYDDMNVEPGRTYYYQVSARNGSDEGSRSNEVSASVPVQKWTVSGRCSSDGEGIGNARVVFEPQEPPYQTFEVRTDGSGHYSIELAEGNYRMRVESDGYDGYEDYVNVDGPLTRDVDLKGKDGEGEKFNLTKELGIDTDEIEKVAKTAAVIAGVYLCSLPVMIFIIMIFVVLVFFRLGKVKKELRLRNQNDGLFLSERQRRKFEARSTKGKKTAPPKDKPAKKEK